MPIEYPPHPLSSGAAACSSFEIPSVCPSGMLLPLQLRWHVWKLLLLHMPRQRKAAKQHSYCCKTVLGRRGMQEQLAQATFYKGSNYAAHVNPMNFLVDVGAFGTAPTASRAHLGAISILSRRYLGVSRQQIGATSARLGCISAASQPHLDRISAMLDLCIFLS